FASWHGGRRPVAWTREDTSNEVKGGAVSTTPATVAHEKLSGFHGQLIGPRDGQYEQARSVYNAMIDKRPALIARCADREDVARAVGFARDHDLLLAIRGGSHNGAGLGTCDDG